MKYSIDDKKQAELNRLKKAVTDAQYTVDQLQANVNSLMEKSQTFTGFENEAESYMNTALTNSTLVKKVHNDVKDLLRHTGTAQNQSAIAKDTSQTLASQMADLVNHLIYSLGMIDKLSQLINKKKETNPLISNELVLFATEATKAGNLALANTLTALESCYIAMASNLKTQEITLLEFTQCAQLEALLTGQIKDESATLNTDLASIELGISKLNTIIQALKAKQATLTNTIKTSNNTIDSNTKKINTNQLALKKLNTELNSLNTELTKAKTEPEKKALDVKIAKVTASIQTATKTVTDLTEANKQLQLKITESQKEQQTLTQSIAYETDELSKLNEQKTAVQNEIEALPAPSNNEKASLLTTIEDIYEKSKQSYKEAQKANNEVTAELNESSLKLHEAQDKLASLQAGLAAANAAALAS